MNVTLTKELEELVEAKVRSGRYLDASDVVREALRVWEQQDCFESPELEAALLAGAEGPYSPLNDDLIDRIRASARRSE